MKLIQLLLSFVKNCPQANRRRSEEGFTVLELLVASVLLLMMAILASSTILFIKRAYTEDSVRKQINQNLRGTLDIIGADLRVGGENLPSAFPAFELIDGGAGPDELVVRRNLLDEVLKVCEKIKANTAEPHIYFAIDLVTPGCIFSDNTHNFEVWRAYRLSHEGSVRAYIVNMATGLGEFFTYTGEDITGHKYRIWSNKDKWLYNYDVNASAVYLLEEWRYRIRNGVLEVMVGGDETTAFNVMLDAVNFNVTITMNDGSIMDSFDASDKWTDVLYLDVEVTAVQQTGGVSRQHMLRSRYFPRNILSF